MAARLFHVQRWARQARALAGGKTMEIAASAPQGTTTTPLAWNDRHLHHRTPRAMIQASRAQQKMNAAIRLVSGAWATLHQDRE